jgi:hypothetical protein
MTIEGGNTIRLPWPPASLSGHNTGNRYSKAAIIAKHRERAKNATLEILPPCFRARDDGDILLFVTFYPPNRRGDRVNFPNRMKPYFDGIADALKVNDSRFLPSFHYAEPIKGGSIIVSVMP